MDIMTIGSIITVVFLVTGVFFFMAGTIGLLRLPDFFSRMHATGKGDTLAVLLCLIGLAIYNAFEGNFALPYILVSIKIVFIAIFWFLAGPTATHAISRAAFRCGVKPWTLEHQFKEVEKQ
ncbi:MAG: monovalent cation/H(+) antiporter subunit G [Thermodesulfobacteriota bacterium]|nr:monovalent cation/H(+) antiporter subunit G [Thermodesulfobacteriota bacterium]